MLHPTLRTAPAVLAASLGIAGLAGTARSQAPATPSLQQRPLAFVENRGQWAAAARFGVERGSERVWVTDDGFWLQAEAAGDLGVALRFSFGGADAATGDSRTAIARTSPAASGEARQDGLRHWLTGVRQVTDVPAFAAVRHRGLLPGTDLVLRDGGGFLEYDLVLREDVDLATVRVRVEGHDGLRLLADGRLRIDTVVGPLHQTPPRSWRTQPDDARVEVGSRFVVLSADEFGFQVDGGAAGELTIDPGLIWGSFLGGSLDDRCDAVDFDSNGRVAVAGSTLATDLPTTPGSYRPSAVGNRDAFVAVFDATGQNLVYCTYLGGLGDEFVGNIRSAGAGRLAIAGWTDSTNYPVTGNRYQQNNAAGFDGFATILTATGAALDYSTYFGGLGDQTQVRLYMAPNGNIHLAGLTDGTVPITGAAFQGTRAGQRDLFYALLNRAPGSTSLTYGTYYGGTGDEMDCSSLHVDGFGIATIGGTTNSTNCPGVAGPNTPAAPGTFYALTYPGGQKSGLLICFDPAQSGNTSFVYWSYFGQAGGDTERLMCELDSDGFFSCVATTSSPNWPASPVAFQSTYGGGASDVIVFRANGGVAGPSALMLLTYLGGSGAESATAFHLQYVSNTTELTSVVGSTTSTNFPTRPSALQGAMAGTGRSGFVAQVDTRIPGAGMLVYGSYFDGCLAGDDELRGIQRNAAGELAVAGYTAASVAPGTRGSVQTRNGGGQDGIVALLDTIAQPAPFGTFGAGCGVPGFVPAITVGTPPRMCFPFSCNVGNLRANAVGLMMMGLSNTNWNGAPLPLPLDSQGLTGCNLLISPDTSFLLFASGTSTTFGFPTPASMDYYGADLFLQFVMFDAAANPFGAALSNGARLNLQF